MQFWRARILLHPTWHFSALCGGVVLGLALSGTSFGQWFVHPAWFLAGCSVFGFVWWKRWMWLIVLAGIAGLLIGLTRGSLDMLSRDLYAQNYGKIVTFRGVVADDIDRGKQGEMIIRLKNIRSGDQHLPAEVWVTTHGKKAIERSDLVTVRGTLRPGFGNFAASMYRADITQITRPQPGDVALHMRDDFGDKVRTGIQEPAASLAMGFLTGQRRSLPEELDQALRIAGLTHIVVASGYNLTILVRFIKRFAEKRSRYLTAFLSSCLIGGFIAITGLSPSMVRAGLIAGLALMAWYFGRKFHPVTLLLFAAAATGLFEPSYVWGNLGWQLSFAAFGGVMIVAPLLQAYFFGDAKPRLIRQIAGETIAAQLATTPLILHAFGQFSNVAIVTNLLVLPLVPLAMLGTFVTGLCAYVVPPLAPLSGAPTQWLLDYMIGVTHTMAGLSWAQTSVELSFVGLLVCYGVLSALCWWMWRTTNYRLRSSSIVE
jgi:competence protein ComEC